MDVDALLYRYVTDGLRKNRKNHVGIELEFPLIAHNGARVETATAKELFAALQSIGYEVFRTAKNGAPIAARDEAGNVATFDTCYENFEFASASAVCIQPIYRRFRETLAIAQESLAGTGCMLAGIGYNPYAAAHHPHMVENPLTLAIEKFMEGKRDPSRAYHYHKDFYCSVSSEQVHFNSTPEELPEIFELFTRMDWLNILLFSDSPATLGGETFLCARNELYMRSRLRALGLVGAQELGAKTAEDIAKSYEGVKIFMRERNGALEAFQPVSVREYFGNEAYGAREEDIAHLDLERNIVTTSYGTIEYRMLCSQPFDRAFTPSAFSLGLRVNLKKALDAARDFDAARDMPAPNERNEQASRGAVSFASPEETRAYARALLSLSREGLLLRGYGEEALLRPIEKREDILTSPAREFLEDMENHGLREAMQRRASQGEPLL